MQALADHADERQGRLFGQRDADVPRALHRIAALRLASVCNTPFRPEKCALNACSSPRCSPCQPPCMHAHSCEHPICAG